MADSEPRQRKVQTLAYRVVEQARDLSQRVRYVAEALLERARLAHANTQRHTQRHEHRQERGPSLSL